MQCTSVCLCWLIVGLCFLDCLVEPRGSTIISSAVTKHKRSQYRYTTISPPRAKGTRSQVGPSPEHLIHLEKQHRGKLLEILLEQLREEIELRQKLTESEITPEEAAEIQNRTHFLDNDIKDMVDRLEHRNLATNLGGGEMSNSQIKQLLKPQKQAIAKIDDHALDLEEFQVHQAARPPRPVEFQTELKPMCNSKLALETNYELAEKKTRRHPAVPNAQIYPVAILKTSGKKDPIPFNPEQAVAILKSPAFQKQLLNEVAQQIDLKRCKQKGAVSLEDSIVALEIKSILQTGKVPETTTSKRIPRRRNHASVASQTRRRNFGSKRPLLAAFTSTTSASPVTSAEDAEKEKLVNELLSEDPREEIQRFASEVDTVNRLKKIKMDISRKKRGSSLKRMKREISFPTESPSQMDHNKMDMIFPTKKTPGGFYAFFNERIKPVRNKMHTPAPEALDIGSLETQELHLLKEQCQQQKVLLDMLDFAGSEAVRSPPVDEGLLNDLLAKQEAILDMSARLKQIRVKIASVSQPEHKRLLSPIEHQLNTYSHVRRRQQTMLKEAVQELLSASNNSMTSPQGQELLSKIQLTLNTMLEFQHEKRFQKTTRTWGPYSS